MTRKRRAMLLAANAFMLLLLALGAGGTQAAAQGQPYCGCFTSYTDYSDGIWWSCGLSSYSCPGPPYETNCQYICNAI